MSSIQFKSVAFNQAVAAPSSAKKPEDATAKNPQETSVKNPLSAQEIKANMSSKDQVNSQIVESIRVSMGSETRPQDLLYKTAVEEINKILGQAYAVEDVPVEGYLEQQMQEDNSSQATANRILSFSLGLFPAFAAQNKELEGEELAKKFISVIQGGFEQGYNEAAKILEGLSVFEGSIKSDIEETRRLVSEGYAAFIKQFAENETETTEQNA